jgi:electron transport complex protein RnfB
LERIRAQKAADTDAALKQARVNVTMSRAQLNKSLKAFGHPPIAEQAARLVELQTAFEEAERALAALLQPAAPLSSLAPMAPTTSQVPGAKTDKAALNRAKIQLAMRRAALSKAQAANLPADRIAALNADLAQAEQALNALEAS